MKCKDTKLSIKQKLFIDEYLIDFNATRSYKMVYKAVKNDNVAAVNANTLLRNPKISEYLSKRMLERQKRTEVTQDRVVNELAKIGFAKMTDYLQYKTAKTVIEHDEDGAPIIDYGVIIDVIDSNQIDTSAIQEISISKDGTFKFKLYDKQKSLELLGKHLGMFEKEDKDNTQTINVIHNIPRPPKGGEEE